MTLSSSKTLKRDHFCAQLARIQPVGLVAMPTPFMPLWRLRQALQKQGPCPTLWIKRDDATHISSGGNKLRKLDRVLREAIDQGCDSLVSGGVGQSNSMRQVATAAAVLGMDCHLAKFDGRVEVHSDFYKYSGNALLNGLLGAHIHNVTWVGERNKAIEALAVDLETQGKKPFIVPYGVSNAMGALSYSSVVIEIAEQSEALGINPTAIFAASGSGGTHAGLSLGAQNVLPDCRVICFDVDKEPERVKADSVKYGAQAAQRIGAVFSAESIELRSGFAGPGYGLLSPETIEAMTLTARLEGVFLDPVYTGKAFAGMLDAVRSGAFKSEDHLVFVHTGGLPSLFAYADELSSAL